METAISKSESLLSLMTFNILFENPLESLSSNPSNESWAKRKESVVNLINVYSSDITCLQECILTQLNYIKGLLGEEYSYYGAMSHGAESAHWSDINPIFFKTKRFVFIDGGRQWFSDTPNVQGSTGYGNIIPRTFSWVLLMDSFEEQRNILVINTHLDVMSHGSREKSMEQLYKFISSVDFEYDILFLAGDFNMIKEYDKEMFSKIENELGLTDSHILADDMNKHLSTFNGFQGDLGRRIDYIFYLDKTKLLQSGEYQVILDQANEGAFISDHYPVHVVLNLKKQI